jgi:polyphosphate kinase 2 (PPK2 family)
MILVKFWLHVSEEEQLRRFQSRAADPLRSWKLTDEDWRNRGRRSTYEKAIEDMLERTDHKKAPWHLVAGDDKRYARVKVIETVCESVEAELSALGFDLSGPHPALTNENT